jgi:hypothetical protein
MDIENIQIHEIPERAVIVLRVDAFTMEQFEKIRDGIKAQRPDVMVVMGTGDFQLDVLDEAAMRRNGWIRVGATQ